MPRKGRERVEPLNARLIADFVRLRAPHVLAPREVQRLGAYLTELHLRGGRLPALGRGFRWGVIAERCGIDPGRAAAARDVLGAARPATAWRAAGAAGPDGGRPPARRASAGAALPLRAAAEPAAQRRCGGVPRGVRCNDARPGPDPYIAFPRARGLGLPGQPLDTRGLGLGPLHAHQCGQPRHPRRHRTALAPVAGRSAGHLPRLRGVSYRRPPLPVAAMERSLLRWHLPDDFHHRRPAAQEEILAWVREVVVRGATDWHPAIPRGCARPPLLDPVPGPAGVRRPRPRGAGEEPRPRAHPARAAGADGGGVGPDRLQDDPPAGRRACAGTRGGRRRPPA